MDPNDRFNNQMSEEEYRRRQAAKAKRRKKRQMQRILLLAAFALAAILLILGIVAIFRAIFGGDEKGKDKTKNSSSSSSSVSMEVELPTEGPGISWPVAPDASVWNLLLVNGQRPLAEDYEYETAVVTDVGHKVDARIAEALKQMVAACNAEEGHSLSIASGARSAETQNEKYKYLVEYFKGQGHDDSAAAAMASQIEPPAGYGEHQTGLAVDFVTGTVNEPSQAFAETVEFAWLTEHAHEYGFILRYPSEKEAITGILVQPYHFRYVGVEDATTMKNAGICLEEYLAALPDEEAEPPTAPETDSGSGSGSNAGEDPGGETTD